MRAFALLAAVVACTGCSRFEHPIVGAQGPELDAALIGDWEAAQDDDHVRLRIGRDRDAGLLVLSGVNEGKSHEDRLHLVTSRIGQSTFASVQAVGESTPDEAPGSWYYFRYELPAPDRLVIYADDGERWRDAVRDGLVAGSTPEDPKAKNFTVTTSGAELRAFLEGYGAVIFKDEATAEFHPAIER